MGVLCKLLEVPLTDSYAAGDEENDISMIMYAGMGVAMGNAKESVKQVANHITTTNNQNGVGEVIKKYLL